MNVASGANIVISEDSAKEQEEIKRATRMTLKEVQNVNTQKENYHPKPQRVNNMSKDAVITAIKGPTEAKRTRTVAAKAVQTATQEEVDITSDKPGEGYWEKIAEHRRTALEKTLDENFNLRLEISKLQGNLDKAHLIIKDLSGVVDVLNEIIGKGGSPKIRPDDDSGIVHADSDSDA